MAVKTSHPLAAIEAVLNQFPGVEAQVVAAKDNIAGEVPVAIVRKLPAGDNPQEFLSTSVRTLMGLLHVSDEILTLEGLGLDDYPRTTSGKVQKATLRNLVVTLRKSRDPDITQLEHESKSKSIEQTVLQVWWPATGIPPANLDIEAPTAELDHAYASQGHVSQGAWCHAVGA